MSAPEPCDHEWVFQDDSFDHEFGCERVHYMRCEKCEAVKECEDDSPDFCEPEPTP
jgi:hypothetical protein